MAASTSKNKQRTTSKKKKTVKTTAVNSGAAEESFVVETVPEPLPSVDVPEVPTEIAVETSHTPPHRWIFPAVAAALVLLIGGGSYAYFGLYAQTPEYLWKTSLSNTRQGLQAIINNGPSSKNGIKLDGSFKMTTPIAADGTLTGSKDDKKADLKLTAGVSGIRANLEMRVFSAGTNGSDVYANISGIKNIAALLGLSGQQAAVIDSIDGKWLVADHTLIDQLLKSTGNNASDLANESQAQIQKDVQDIVKKAAVVLNDRLFSDNKSKAVVVIKDKLAKEDFEGRKSQHLRVQIQKQQLHDFAVAMKDALKNSKLNTWLVAPNSSKSFEQATGFDSLLKNIDAKNYDYSTADVWIDLSTNTIRDVRIYASPTDAKSYVDFMFNYTGGDDYPLRITSMSTNASGTQNLLIGATLNRATNKVSLTFSGTGTNAAGRQSINVGATLTITPTDDKVTVEKPPGATNIVNLLGGLTGQVQGLQDQLRVESPLSSGSLEGSGLLQ